MPPLFPPPDPHESSWTMPTDGLPIAAPTVVFAAGSDDHPDASRIADRVLDARPGLFIVVASVT